MAVWSEVKEGGVKIDDVAAVVTGGGSGPGLDAAHRLAQAGARVTLLDLDAERGAQAAAEINGFFVRTDITDEAQVKSALTAAQARHGPARILVNCAGIAPPAKVICPEGTPLPLADFTNILAVNLGGTFNYSRSSRRTFSTPK